MSKLAVTGLALASLGFIGREYFHFEATSIWMHQAFKQGMQTGDTGAPMNYFHAEWPLSQGIELLGYGSLAAILGGLGLVAYGLMRHKQ